MSVPPKVPIDQALKVFQRHNGFIKHLLAGSASGLITGACVGFAGKTFALVAGSGIIAYEVAHYKGFVKQDLESLQKVVKTTAINAPTYHKVRAFAMKNRVFSSGFVGGLLLGLAF